MVGFAGTSNIAVATAEGLTAVGTMEHSSIEAFTAEEEAFRAFARSHPGPVTFLVDTYEPRRASVRQRVCCEASITPPAGAARRYGWTVVTSVPSP
jgi:nicotinic acid phosphoribosyltransferase